MGRKLESRDLCCWREGRQLKPEVGRLKAYPKGGYFLAPTWVGGRLLSNKGDSSL